MTKYLISRLILVFLCKFFYSWATNIIPQSMQFFNIKNNSILVLLVFIVFFLILGLGLLAINLFFSTLHITEKSSFDEIVKKIKENGFLKTSKHYIENFRTILINNFKIEKKAERYPFLFIIFSFIFLYFSKGNPILNNYYGIYKEYVKEADDYFYTREEQSYIVHKSKKKEIKNRMDRLEESYEEDGNEDSFDVKKRGYLFIQAGLIDGHKTYYKGYKGLFPYIECLFFSALEKLINTIMYFFIPFITSIMIYHYKYEKSKTTNS